MDTKEKILRQFVESESFRDEYMEFFLKILIHATDFDKNKINHEVNQENRLVDYSSGGDELSAQELQNYLKALQISGAFDGQPDALTFNRTIFALTGETIPLADSAICIDNFYNKVARTTAPEDIPSKNDPTKKYAGPPDETVKALFTAAAEPTSVAKTLTRARESVGMTKVAVAEAMGKSEGLVRQIESGSRNSNIKTLKEYAKAIGMQVEIRLIPENDINS